MTALGGLSAVWQIYGGDMGNTHQWKYMGGYGKYSTYSRDIKKLGGGTFSLDLFLHKKGCLPPACLSMGLYCSIQTVAW